MFLETYLQDPRFLIGPTLGAVAGCALGYFAARRNRWHTSSALLLAFLILLSMAFARAYGVEPAKYKAGVVAYTLVLIVPAFFPFLMSDICMAVNRKVRPRTLLVLEVAAGVLGLLVYPIWQFWIEVFAVLLVP